MYTKEEIKDFLDVNSEKDIIDYIFRMEADLRKYRNAIDASQYLIKDSISKARYNDLVKRYNKLEKEYAKLIKNNL
jgi:hypothetical protein